MAARMAGARSVTRGKSLNDNAYSNSNALITRVVVVSSVAMPDMSARYNFIIAMHSKKTFK